MITIETATDARLKSHAEPLVDTHDSVINRALDALDALKKGAAPTTNERVLNPASPPNLSYTTVKSVTLNGQVFPAAETYWNLLLLAVVREASKTLTTKEVAKLLLSKHIVGQKEDNGYKYLADVGISVQGQDANSAWKSTYNVLKAIKVPVEVVFTWQDNPKAAAPNTTGKFNVVW